MADFFFSEDEVSMVSACINKGHSSWKDECLKELKSRIKEHLKVRQDHVCCYCLRNLHGEFNFVIDIEHILPKHRFTNFMFTLDNLAASCKRCNMKMKGRRIDFITENFDNNPNPFASENYFFIHPNSDHFEEHIAFTHTQIGREIAIFYNVIDNSPKGLFSYDFFRLDKLVKNSFDKAQGISVEDEDFYEGDPEDDDINDDDEHIKSIYIEDEIEFLARKNDQL
ncbi:hypothetical protein R0H17_26740 [Phytobacter diazotrophicus]|uniref:HNH endonuclease n=1 Tax=Phytobacter diazotrophicus TaxID=395631 RepID=UPI0029364475|nr:HNH endonuclease [Phytobacter diazotrophicus]MDV2905223.1 hypothetical protein [Phytobacter diazotrophicus]